MHVVLVLILPIGEAPLLGSLASWGIFSLPTENFVEIFSIVFQLPFQVRKSMARIKVVIAERVSRVESY